MHKFWVARFWTLTVVIFSGRIAVVLVGKNRADLKPKHLKQLH